MDLETIYGLIGPCGVAIVIIGIAAVFICARSLIYTALSWREFKQRFLDVQRGDERCLRDYEGSNASIEELLKPMYYGFERRAMRIKPPFCIYAEDFNALPFEEYKKYLLD